MSKRTHIICLLATSLIGIVFASGTLAAAQTSPTTQASDYLQTVKTKGDQEIARRLKALAALTANINVTSKLTPSDKTSLTEEATTESKNLSTLRTKLAAETTLAGAAADVQSMVAEYRVYALVIPKVRLIKTADAQQIFQAQLTAFAAKLQTRITAADAKGKNVTDLQTKLDDMLSKMAVAESISANVESKVLTLEPTDYNNDHGILAGYQTQLKSAHQNDLAALASGKLIVQGLKAL